VLFFFNILVHLELYTYLSFNHKKSQVILMIKLGIHLKTNFNYFQTIHSKKK